MNLSKKISPLWGVAAGLSFVGGITALYMNSTYAPDPVVPATRLSGSFAGLFAYSNGVNPSEEHPLSTIPAKPVQMWEASYDLARDEECNGRKDYAIGSMRRGVGYI
jgi:hypothetical protein